MPALDRLAGGDEARAYAAWARAVGEPIAGGTRPRAFRRGQLTVECASSVWAGELTYLGPQILRRMDEVAPGHPVERFRFIVAWAERPGSEAEAPPSPVNAELPPPIPTSPTPASPASALPPSRQGSGSPSMNEEGRCRQPTQGSLAAARAQAEGVRDQRLRAAIEAALRPSSEELPPAPGGGPSPG